MSEPFSASTFNGFLTFLVVGLCAPLLLSEIRNLARAMKGDPRDPVVRDKRFGYSMGILIAIVGIYGTLKFNGVL